MSLPEISVPSPPAGKPEALISKTLIAAADECRTRQIMGLRSADDLFSIFRHMSRQLSQFFEIGFHGDTYLIELVFAAAQRCPQYVETGANVGSSLCHLARSFPEVQCHSCEPDAESFQFARQKAGSLANVHLYHEASPQFFHTVAGQQPGFCGRETVFWLDSHGYGFRWPLREEIEFITGHFDSAHIFIDDFKVPGQPQFLFDEYDGQICGLELIADRLAKGRDYRFILPCYQDKTSTHHPLKGWILITYGRAGALEVPSNIKSKVTIAPSV